MRYLTILYLVLGFSGMACWDYSKIDSASYQEYLRNDFSSMKKTYRMAKFCQVSFYYLHMRAGITAWNHADYEYAIPAFESALTMNPTDTLAQEYLYYSLLYSGQTERAGDFISNYSRAMQRKVGNRETKREYVIISMSQFSGKHSETSLNQEEQVVSGYSSNGMTSLSFGIGGKVSHRMRIMSSLHYFGSSGNHFVQNNLTSISNPYRSTSFHAALGGSIQRKRTTYFITSSLFTTKYSEQFTLPGAMGPMSQSIWDDTLFTAVSLTGGLQHSKRYWRWGAQTTLSGFNSSFQYQMQGNVTLYPLGNQKWYLFSGITFIENQQSSHWVSQFKTGFQLRKRISLHATYAKGSMLYYASDNGYSNYFTTDPISREWGLALTYSTKKVDISTGFYSQKRTQTLQYLLTDGSQISKNLNYSPYLLNLTLKWKL